MIGLRTRERPHGLAGEYDAHRDNDPVEKGEAVVDALDESEDPDHSERDQEPPRAAPIHVAHLPRFCPLRRHHGSQGSCAFAIAGSGDVAGRDPDRVRMLRTRPQGRTRMKS